MHHTIYRLSFLTWKSLSPSLSSLQTSFFPAFHSLLHPPFGVAFTELPQHCVLPLPHPVLLSPCPAQNFAVVLLFYYDDDLKPFDWYTVRLIRNLLNKCVGFFFLKLPTCQKWFSDVFCFVYIGKVFPTWNGFLVKVEENTVLNSKYTKVSGACLTRVDQDSLPSFWSVLI